MRSRLVLAWSIACLGFVLLTGCKVGPNFSRPKPPLISPEYAEATVPETATYEDLTYWWAALNDPTLDSLIAEACRQNLDLREAYYRVVVSRARLGVVRADRLPHVHATGEYAYRDFAENASQFISSSAGNRGFNFNSMGFDSRWEIDLFGKIARAIESAAAELDAEFENYRDVKVILLAEVASTYTQLRLAQERIEIAQRNLAAQQATLRVVRERHESGLVSPLDVAQAESNVYITAATIPALQQLETVASNQIAFLLGRTPDARFRERLAFGRIPSPPSSLGVGLPADLLARRPDIRRAELEVASASALIGVAVAEKYPQISILGTISVDAKDVGMWFDPGSLAHSIGPSFRWNIINFNQLNNAIEGRSAEFQIAIVNYQRTVLAAVQEVEDGLVTFHRQGQRAVELQRAIGATQRAVSSGQVRYESGLIGFQPLLDSQREQLFAEDTYANSRAETLLGIIRVYKALGGGWNSRCCVEIAANESPAQGLNPPTELVPEQLPKPQEPTSNTQESNLNGQVFRLPPLAPAVGSMTNTGIVRRPTAEYENQHVNERSSLASPTGMTQRVPVVAGRLPASPRYR